MFHHGANEGGGKSVGGGRERELTQKKCSASKRQAWRADRSRFCSAPFSFLSLYVILLLLRRGRSQRRRTCEHRCRRSICADAPTISSLPPGGLYPALSRRWAPVICVLRPPVGLNLPVYSVRPRNASSGEASLDLETRGLCCVPSCFHLRAAARSSEYVSSSSPGLCAARDLTEQFSGVRRRYLV